MGKREKNLPKKISACHLFQSFLPFHANTRLHVKSSVKSFVAARKNLRIASELLLTACTVASLGFKTTSLEGKTIHKSKHIIIQVFSQPAQVTR